MHMLGAHVEASKTQKRRARKQRTNERIAAAGQQIDDRSRNHKRHRRPAPPAELQQRSSSLQHVAAAVGVGASDSDRSDWFNEIVGDDHAVRWRYPPSTFLDRISTSVFGRLQVANELSDGSIEHQAEEAAAAQVCRSHRTR